MLYDTDFNGSLIAWIIGLPFIISIILLDKKTKIDNLIMKQFRNGEEVDDHIKYILYLIDKYNNSNDKNAYILLRGYIIKHMEVCEELECPLKIHM